jgi:predicted dinucleotide-binding enzyme
LLRHSLYYGFENFENNNYPDYGNLKPAMLIAGDDSFAKQTITQLCQDLGWETIDIGNLAMSLHLEHLTLLWIKMARVQGWGAGFVWAMLRK